MAAGLWPPWFPLQECRPQTVLLFSIQNSAPKLIPCSTSRSPLTSFEEKKKFTTAQLTRNKTSFSLTAMSLRCHSNWSPWRSRTIYLGGCQWHCCRFLKRVMYAISLAYSGLKKMEWCHKKSPCYLPYSPAYHLGYHSVTNSFTSSMVWRGFRKHVLLSDRIM